jgi:DNA-directed RNA polymerase subunit RPC12/RpoP
MEGGGSPDFMTHVVNAYNDCGRDDFEGDLHFLEWANSGSFKCTTCGRTFRVDQLKSPPAPKDEVTCDTCKTEEADDAAETRPGVSVEEQPNDSFEPGGLLTKGDDESA